MLKEKLHALVDRVGSVDLIVPVYNEELILKKQLGGVLEQLPDRFTVTVVENGSTDATDSVLKGMRAEYPQLRVLSLAEPSYGNAVRHGLESSSADILMIDDLDVLDTDFWVAGLAVISGGSVDMVQGSKILAGKNDRRPFTRKAATRVLTILLRLFLGFKGTDTHGPKIMKRSSFTSIFPLCGNEPDLYPSELIIRAQRLGLVITELPISLAEIRATPLPLYRRVPRAVRDLFLLMIKLGRG